MSFAHSKTLFLIIQYIPDNLCDISFAGKILYVNYINL